MLFAVCSAVTVECFVLYPCCVGVFGMFAVCKEEGSSQCLWVCLVCLLFVRKKARLSVFNY